MLLPLLYRSNYFSSNGFTPVIALQVILFDQNACLVPNIVSIRFKRTRKSLAAFVLLRLPFLGDWTWYIIAVENSVFQESLDRVIARQPGHVSDVQETRRTSVECCRLLIANRTKPLKRHSRRLLLLGDLSDGRPSQTACNSTRARFTLRCRPVVCIGW